MECRGTIVTACLTLIQSWLNGGAKYGSGILGGYEEWAGVASGILEHAGIAGFNENRRLIQTRSDAQAIANEAMVQLWWEQHGNSPVRASDLLAVVENLEFPPVTIGETDRGTTSSLGRWLRKHEGTVIGNQKICVSHLDSSTGSTYYQLMPMEGLRLVS